MFSRMGLTVSGYPGKCENERDFFTVCSRVVQPHPGALSEKILKGQKRFLSWMDHRAHWNIQVCSHCLHSALLALPSFLSLSVQ